MTWSEKQKAFHEMAIMMGTVRTVFTLLVLLNGVAFANVEKTIFVAPSRQPVPDASIHNLLLVPLNPQHSTARTWLNATFPVKEALQATDTWILLEGLSPGTRYEVRVCWLATQPTAFTLTIHTLDAAFENTALLSSLTVFSNTRRNGAGKNMIQQLRDRKYKPSLSTEAAQPSLLFLQISAAADYFSLNQTLMEHVSPVLVDVILDRYLLNVLPRSLAPTAGYIVVLAVGSWFLSTFLWRALNLMVRIDAVQAPKSKKNS